MARISEHFGLDHAQAALDFVDVELQTDNHLHIDPFAIQNRNDMWSANCGDHIRSFFQAILEALYRDDLTRVAHLLANLHEPNETRLGQSVGRPRGRAVGQHKAELLAEALKTSRAFDTQLLADVSEAELFIRGIGPDTISDLTTNVVRGPLSKYTKEQCELLGVPTQNVGVLGPVWLPDSLEWEAQVHELPVADGIPVLLVPKYAVRRTLSLDSQEFWDSHMIEFLRQEYLKSGSALVKTLKKDGSKYVTKVSVKERHPKVKDDLAQFVNDHPSVFEAYKRLKRGVGPLANIDFQEDFDEAAFAEALIPEFGLIESGKEGGVADRYHRLMLGVSTFLFYPNLVSPKKEYRIDEGRKRVDIRFQNNGEFGFFKNLLNWPNTRSIEVMMECKNYGRDANNPELDQMAGRLSVHRGFFGVILCRTIDNVELMQKRCRDYVRNQSNYIVVLCDNDVIEMLRLVADGKRSQVDQFMREKLDLLIK